MCTENNCFVPKGLAHIHQKQSGINIEICESCKLLLLLVKRATLHHLGQLTRMIKDRKCRGSGD